MRLCPQLTYCVSLPSRIDAVSLADQHKSTGELIILRIMYLDMFMDGPILQSVLDDIEVDFGSMSLTRYQLSILSTWQLNLRMS